MCSASRAVCLLLFVFGALGECATIVNGRLIRVDSSDVDEAGYLIYNQYLQGPLF
jgi:hypothetical protein